MTMGLLCFFLVEIREAFRVLDRDGNGFISKQELGMAMRSLGYMPSEVELAIIMQRLDMDGKAAGSCPQGQAPTQLAAAARDSGSCLGPVPRSGRLD